MSTSYRTATLLTAALGAVAAGPASAETLLALTTENSIAVVDTDAPNVSLDGGFVRGLEANESLLGIDYRAADEQVYLLGSFDNLYTLDVDTNQASLVGNFGSPSLTGTSFGFDFNPAFMEGEFARIVSDTDDNRVISGDTGQYLVPDATDLFYADGDPNAGSDANIAGIAYTNSLGVPDSTQQFAIDATLGVLATLANNAGTLETVGSLGVNNAALTNELGLDISGATGIAYASLQTGPNSQLYTVDLDTGAATLVGRIASGDLIRSIAVIPDAGDGGGDPPAVVPTPGAAALGLVGLAFVARRRRG